MGLGFYFDISQCAGCRVCQVACKDRNNLAIGELYRKVRSFESGAYPSAAWYHYSASCNHCDAPACVANCPTGAMQKIAVDGTVQHDDELCIGCGTCVKSCPYSVPILLSEKGIAGKCDACKPFRDAGQNPVCVDACNMRCIEFGDLDELAEKYGEGVKDLPFLASSSATNPNILIKTKESALNTSYSELVL